MPNEKRLDSARLHTISRVTALLQNNSDYFEKADMPHEQMVADAAVALILDLETQLKEVDATNGIRYRG